MDHKLRVEKVEHMSQLLIYSFVMFKLVVATFIVFKKGPSSPQPYVKVATPEQEDERRGRTWQRNRN